MTGFGRASIDAGDRRLSVEIRSVNHRGLDLKVRTAEPDAYCDSEIGRAVRAALERGSVTVSIREEEAEREGGINEHQVRAVYATLERLRQELEIEEPIDLDTVGAFMSSSGGSGPRGEALWETLQPGVARALAELGAMRAREGEALGRDLAQHCARLEELAASLRRATAALPERFARRLTERLAGLAQQPGWDPGRLAQEAAFVADRLDVSEELVRLDTHIGHFRELIDQTAAGAGAGGASARAASASGEPPRREQGTGSAVGRKLDFLIQELGRELNTIASKSQDAGVAAMVIDAKAELEKMREQAQNVE